MKETRRKEMMNIVKKDEENDFNSVFNLNTETSD